jgi:putative oxidoreductase
MRRLIYSNTTGPLGSISLLVLRLVVGAAFLFHGWPKIQNATGWMGEPGQAVPGFMQAVAAIAEFAGGIALIAGLLTRIAALGIGGVMVGALAMVHLPKGDPFVAPPGAKSGSWELAAIYLACALVLLAIGPGLFSLDTLLFGPRKDEKTRLPVS